MMQIRKVEATRQLVPLEYNTRTDGTHEAILRRNIVATETESDDGVKQTVWQADEIQLVGAEKPAEWYQENIARIFAQAEREAVPESDRLFGVEEGLDDLVLVLAEIIGGDEE